MATTNTFGKLDLSSSTARIGSDYPAPFDLPCRSRARLPVGDLAGLTQIGVNRLELPPGAWSSQRHWHSLEDEFVWVISGEVVLVTDAGEELLSAGNCAGFRAGVANGHRLQNRSGQAAVLMEVGSWLPEGDVSTYADIDLIWSARRGYTGKSATGPLSPMAP